MALKEYRKKRDFRKTGEPAGRGGRARGQKSTRQPRAGTLSFVVQQHHASHAHFDFRLELDGVLKSWAVPKGPSLDPHDKRLAVQVEDHPIEYAGFEGIIPEGQYGAGSVIVWDNGAWTPAAGTDPHDALRRGSLKFTLAGKKLRGGWALVRMKGSEGDKRSNWLLIKEKDRSAREKDAFDIVAERPRSVLSRKTIEQIARQNGKAPVKEWTSNRKSRTLRPRARAKSRVRRTAGAASDADERAAPECARPADFPSMLAPQLATLVETVPEGEGWLHEVKFDGYRTLAFVNGDDVRLLTRSGLDWTARFPEVRDALVSKRLPPAILDGEIVALAQNGISRFQSLQAALKEGRTRELVYFVFDLPYYNGYDLTACALRDRAALLREILAGRTSPRGRIRLSDHIQGHGADVLRSACRLGLEGIVSKQLDSPYVSARTTAWVKVKCGRRQEFVIAGYTEPKGSRSGFGSVLIGYHDAAELMYAGKVGAGFDESDLARLSQQFKTLKQDEPAFVNAPRIPRSHWIAPRLVAEVSFTEWTADGRLRHPVFLGLREDKEASDVKRETTNHAKTRSASGKPVARPRRKTVATPSQDSTVAGVRITHPERVVYSPQGLTKLDIARYYEAVADAIMPHALDRPLSLVRCPGGAGAQCFFHKHIESENVEGLRTVPISESKGTGRYAAATSIHGLVYLVQMNTLEFHGWQARADKVERPDRIVLDLDPGEGVAWSRVAEGARKVRSILDELELQSFVMTTGGKGLHVIVPIVRRIEWDQAKAFARSVAEALETTEPDRYTANMSKAKRRGKVFIDYLRTQRGATSILPYSTRARAGAPVAMPIEWDDIEETRPDAYSVSNTPKHIAARKKDPWVTFFKSARAIPAAVFAG